MNAHVKPTMTMNVWRLWPWLVMAALAVLIGLLLRLGAVQSTDTPVVMAIPQPVSTTTPLSTTVPESTASTVAEAPTADGIVDPVPVATYLPVASGEVPNEQRAHAGDDSMFLKDDESTGKVEDKDDVGGA